MLDGGGFGSVVGAWVIGGCGWRLDGQWLQALGSGPRYKISVISEISVVQKHGNFDGNIGILSISIKIE